MQNVVKRFSHCVFQLVWNLGSDLVKTELLKGQTLGAQQRLDLNQQTSG